MAYRAGLFMFTMVYALFNSILVGSKNYFIEIVPVTHANK
jgi:hypothetical protein